MAYTASAELRGLISTDQHDLRQFRRGLLTLKALRKKVEIRTRQVRTLFIMYGVALCRDEAHCRDYKSMLTLILHSGDPELMERYLREHNTHNAPEVRVSDRAVIVDKIQLMLGEPQLYGTQRVYGGAK